jgi:hypothetical protein
MQAAQHWNEHWQHWAEGPTTHGHSIESIGNTQTAQTWQPRIQHASWLLDVVKKQTQHAPLTTTYTATCALPCGSCCMGQLMGPIATSQTHQYWMSYMSWKEIAHEKCIVHVWQATRQRMHACMHVTWDGVGEHQIRDK